MKILFVIDTYDTNNNGTSISAQRFADKIGKPSTAAFHIQPQNLWSSVGLGKVDWLWESGHFPFTKLSIRQKNKKQADFLRLL